MAADAFDVVVVGGGHAGCEAAAAAAGLGARTALITLHATDLGRLSCNPAVGGLAKGHLVRELDALGGLMARAADAATVQFRHLNTRRGLAVRSSRAQVDIDAYPQAMATLIRSIPGLTVLEGEVAALRRAGPGGRSGPVTGVVLADGSTVPSRAVVLTTGTFLAAVMHEGDVRTEGGRRGGVSAKRLARQLREAGLRTARLKTGTVPRVAADSVDWDAVEPQTDVVPDGRLSHRDVPRQVAPLACHVTFTTPHTHDLIRGALDRSPLFTGRIEGAGPRYCPSVEDKVVRFPDRDRHRLFLEREGHHTDRVYVSGLSTSLPRDVQEAMVRSIPGLSRARVLQHGYAVEYDVADPRDLDHGLQHAHIPGLYLAGQVNGTSGYEEAAVQGFVAGVSAARGEPLRIGRDQAYLGVLIDDLVTRGVGGEPYRMFSSRAEHRLLLREDNADRRLMPLGRELGLVPDAVWDAFLARQAAHERAMAWLDGTSVSPSRATTARFEAQGLRPPRKPTTARQLLRRPALSWDALAAVVPGAPEVPEAVATGVSVDVVYEGYLARARTRAARARALDAARLPPEVDWTTVPSLSTEVAERLTRARPETLGQVARLPGVTPAAVHVLASWLVVQGHAPRPVLEGLGPATGRLDGAAGG